MEQAWLDLAPLCFHRTDETRNDLGQNLLLKLLQLGMWTLDLDLALHGIPHGPRKELLPGIAPRIVRDVVPGKGCDVETEFARGGLGSLVTLGHNTDKVLSRWHLIYHVAELEEQKEGAWPVCTFTPSNGLRDILRYNVVPSLCALELAPNHFFALFVEKELQKVVPLIASRQPNGDLVANSPEARSVRRRPLDLGAFWEDLMNKSALFSYRLDEAPFLTSKYIGVDIWTLVPLRVWDLGRLELGLNIHHVESISKGRREIEKVNLPS